MTQMNSSLSGEVLAARRSRVDISYSLDISRRASANVHVIVHFEEITCELTLTKCHLLFLVCCKKVQLMLGRVYIHS